MKKKLLFFLKLFFGLGLLAYLIFIMSDPEEILKTLKTTIPVFATLSFSLHAVGIFIKSIRWNILLKENGSVYKLRELMKFYLVSNFFNNFLPTRFGGDIIRISDTKSMKDGMSASAVIVFIERVSGIFILFIFALIASIIRFDFVKDKPGVWITAIAGFLGIIIMFILLKNSPDNYFSRFKTKSNLLKKILNKLDSLHLIVKGSLISNKVMIKVLFWGVILQLNVIIHYYLIGLSLGLNIPFIDYFFIISILLIVLSIPISIGGHGIRETTLMLFFASYGINSAIAISFSFLDVIFNLILGIIGGIIYVSRKK